MDWQASDILAIVSVVFTAIVAILSQVLTARGRKADRAAARRDRQLADLAAWRDRVVPHVVQVREYLDATTLAGIQPDKHPKLAQVALEGIRKHEVELWPPTRAALLEIMSGHPAQLARQAAGELLDAISQIQRGRELAALDLSFAADVPDGLKYADQALEEAREAQRVADNALVRLSDAIHPDEE
jgi:hypothetical protein